MTLPTRPLPRVEEANDVLVESIAATHITVVSANQTITEEGTIWNVGLRELRELFSDREEAAQYAVALAAAVRRPAWIRQDANHPWERILRTPWNSSPASTT